jgi:hypothetical protein
VVGTGPIRTARAFAKLAESARGREQYERYLQARRNLRSGMSFTRAAREAHISPRTLRRFGGSDFQQSGRRIAAVRDRSYRSVQIISNRGVRVVQVSRREASIASGYDRAVARWLRNRDDAELRKFRGVSVAGHELETETDVIDERAGRGELDDFEFYALVS